ncbi:MAG: hypothetical protein ACRDL0_01435, partial [Thermoleophilaceae bacterium]
AWTERAPGGSLEAELAWRPARQPADGPSGKRISTLDEAPGLPSGFEEFGDGVAEDTDRLDLDELEDGDPVDLLRWAIEHDQDVEIVYAGARGTTVRRVTPIELDASRLHAWCHLRDDARSFWLRSLLDAAPVE